jgi:2-amino-4-hydroxy-6-hydroxymethyldihydropteridine diphosphokinase
MKAKQVFISLGSNLGDRLQFLSNAVDQIGLRLGKVVKESKIYEAAAWGHTKQPDFYNQVIEIETELSPLQLLQGCLEIEKSLGRERSILWGERTIDLDILLYDGRSVQLENLRIPHPYLHLRNFVLVPLCEIAPDLIHPTMELSIKQLLDRCADKLNIKAIE